jgi:hypothetical protein
MPEALRRNAPFHTGDIFSSGQQESSNALIEAPGRGCRQEEVFY